MEKTITVYASLTLWVSRVKWFSESVCLCCSNIRTIQQGLFLAAGNLSISFEDNFDAIQQDADSDRVLQIIIGSSNIAVKKEILRHLHRMNINRATLFPGLDGFAQSLNTMLAMPDILRRRFPFE